LKRGLQNRTKQYIAILFEEIASFPEAVFLFYKDKASNYLVKLYIVIKRLKTHWPDEISFNLIRTFVCL
jgi:hypothetical protein